MPAPEGFMVYVKYKNMSTSYWSDKTDARLVLKELAEKTDVLYDWLNVKISLVRTEKGFHLNPEKENQPNVQP